MMNMTEEKATALFNEWVKRLHLGEWDIDFQWRVLAKNMNEPDSTGCTSANVVGRQAIIQMVDPVDYPDSPFYYDYEKTLVHELLHLVFWDMDDSGDDLRDKLTHIMVERLARALVNAKRAGGNAQ